MLLLSFAKGRPTFGDSGKINYLMNVGTTQFFTPHEPDAKHPVHQLSALPHAYEYGSPIAGTYPLWYDPSYWHEGIRPHIDFERQIRTMLLAGAECACDCFQPVYGTGHQCRDRILVFDRDQRSQLDDSGRGSLGALDSRTGGHRPLFARRHRTTLRGSTVLYFCGSSDFPECGFQLPQLLAG